MENMKTDTMQNVISHDELEQVSGGAGGNFTAVHSLYDNDIHAASDPDREREFVCPICKATIRFVGTVFDIYPVKTDHMLGTHLLG